MEIFRTLVICVLATIWTTACSDKGNAQAISSSGDYEVTTEDLWCQRGSNRIYGVLYRPQNAGSQLPLVIMSHGFGGTHGNVRAYAQAVSRKGYLCYCPDFCGGGNSSRSDGKTTEMSIFTEREDLACIVGQLKALPEVDASRIVLMGESQGGMVSAITASQMPDEISCLALFYPAFCIADDAKVRFPSPSDVPDVSSLWGMQLGRAYYEGLYDFDVYDEIGKYTKPVLLLHGDRDNIVDISYSERAASTYPQVEYHVLAGAGHGFSGNNQTTATDYLIEWLSKHVSNTTASVWQPRTEGRYPLCYTLAGIPIVEGVSHLQRGVYIVNGQKTIIQ